MEKKSRKSIIIGITLLLLVTVTLLGLTYAYYRTRVIGNDEETSISVTSKKLEITYSDETAVLNMEGKIAPGFKYNKTFYVENTGDGTVNYGVYLENLVNEFKRTSDWKLTVTCTSNVSGKTCNGVTETDFPSIESLVLMNEIDATEKQTYEMEIEYLDLEEDQSIDMGKNLSAKIQIYDLTNTFKSNTLASKLVNNAMNGTGSTTYRVQPLSIPAQETTTVLTQTEGSATTIALVDASYYTYAAEVEFNELSGYSLVNPQVDTWANIKANAQKLANFKYLRRESGVSSVPEERTQTLKDMVRVDSISENTMTYTMLELAATEQSVESTLSATRDDYGVSFYYRGAVKDNYVNYNGMCWRVVRVLGDGSVKLILASSLNTCENGIETDSMFIAEGRYGFDYDSTTNKYTMNYLNPTYHPGTSMRAKLNNWLEEKNFDTADLKKGDWCIGNVTDAYNVSAPYNKLDTPASDLIETNTNFNYEPYTRLYREYPERATLECGNGLKAEDDYIGTLTADEVTYAGDKLSTDNYEYYLLDNTISDGNEDFVWQLLTPGAFNKGEPEIFTLKPGKFTHAINIKHLYAFRPSIVLNSTVSYNSGNGTIDSPYIVG